MSVVVDESLAAKKFASRLTAYAENIFPFDRRATGIVCHGMFDPMLETGLAKSRQETKFAWIYFLCKYLAGVLKVVRRDHELVMSVAKY